MTNAERLKHWVSRKAKLGVQVPVNVGRNYNGPKVEKRCLNKIWLYAGKSGYLTLRWRIRRQRENVMSADNQQERLVNLGWIIGFVEIVQTMNRQKSKTELIRILRDYTPDTPGGVKI